MSDFLYPVPDLPPDEERDWIVAFNSGWLPILLDAVDNLLHDYLFENAPSDASKQVEQLILMLVTPYECEPPVSTSKRSFMLHQDSIVLNGNALSFAANASQPLNGYWRQVTEAINDEWTTGFTVPEGSHKIRINAVKTNASGKLDLYLDDNFVVQVDLYSAANVFDYVIETNAILMSEGYHVIRGKIASKNASSSSYRCLITAFSIVPSSAD